MAISTINDRLNATGGRPSGFDYLRIILAASVIFFHSFDLTRGRNVAFYDLHGLFRPIDALIVPMFFSLSGFLIAGSLERSRTLISFLGLRAIRLVPALLVETVLSAVVIGLLFSNLSLRQYFSDASFRAYFLNILGDIHYNLPGVFEHNAFPRLVNGQLWTIPFELKCYMAISVIAIVGLVRKKYAFLALVVLLNAAIFVHHSFLAPQPAGHTVEASHVRGVVLVADFLFGIALYLFRTRVIWSKWLFLPSVLGIFLMSSLPFAFWGDYLVPPLVAYATVYIGLLEPKRLNIVSSGDYSYGLYLYGFPVQQAMIATVGPAARHWYINFPASIAISAVIAVGSWHLVEKHAGRLRPRLFRAETRVVERWSALSARVPRLTSGD
ncbi:MAG: acyltransferase [Proteobacteria bacterium]|nr:acyltransferase [Pseudomonadota bacterium]